MTDAIQNSAKSALEQANAEAQNLNQHPYSFQSKEDFQFAYDKIDLEDAGMSNFEKDMLYNITKYDFYGSIPPTSAFSDGSYDTAGSILDVSKTDIERYVAEWQFDNNSNQSVIDKLKKLVEQEKEVERTKIDTMIKNSNEKDGFKEETENIIREKLVLSPDTPITEKHIETFVENWGLSDDSENSLKNTLGFNG